VSLFVVQAIINFIKIYPFIMFMYKCIYF